MWPEVGCNLNGPIGLLRNPTTLMLSNPTFSSREGESSIATGLFDYIITNMKISSQSMKNRSQKTSSTWLGKGKWEKDFPSPIYPCSLESSIAQLSNSQGREKKRKERRIVCRVVLARLCYELLRTTRDGIVEKQVSQCVVSLRSSTFSRRAVAQFSNVSLGLRGH